jgi:hypothetical protein
MPPILRMLLCNQCRTLEYFPVLFVERYALITDSEMEVASAAPPAVKQNILPISHFFQQADFWCWATCMQMVFSLSNDWPRQCDFAGPVFQRNCCVEPFRGGPCDGTLGPKNVAIEWARYNYESVYSESHLEFQTIVDEIEAGNPIEVGIMRSDLSGHAILIVGYAQIGNDQTVVVHDPYHGSGSHPYASLVSGYQDDPRSWWRWSWKSIRKIGA